ncbi:TorD/DmsD family molecular chaperone [Halanaeroarchaeum sulfurireducens]|uniref:Anaerobic dehydrogenase subunit n=1 Tax=Halanaeroarchaeum sulfurireducens TaxID=1604004 RepID=A0A0F7PC66_9EURY|nr:molecular chaperone TorD family protein [Halanaeroarchaeum sulfurireducens]AKH97770.1 anaerobic dehydrogenase subunit [Halanaeroarchaeum sulfurireducens]ALG82165.1 anaerobic dehydrogenase subunit [Halanaeroarchaeum sulfurireducens]
MIQGDDGSRTKVSGTLSETISVNVADRVDLYSLLSECLKHPSDRFIEQVSRGGLEADLRSLTSNGVRDGVESIPIPDGDDPGLRAQYRSAFEGYRDQFAPPAESPYKEWYGDRDGGLMGGPPASAMERRYDALDVDIPASYPPDHVALELEYASLLLEAGDEEAFAAFLPQHLDWIPAFRRLTSRTADAPFYQWVVDLMAGVVVADRDRYDVDPPSNETVNAMVARVNGTNERSVPTEV